VGVLESNRVRSGSPEFAETEFEPDRCRLGNCCAAPCAGHDCPGRKPALDTRASRDHEETGPGREAAGRCLRVTVAMRESSRESGADANGRASFPSWDRGWRGMASVAAPGWRCLGDAVLCRPSCGRRPERWGTDQAPLPIRTAGLIRTRGTPPSSPCQRINPAFHRECGRNGRAGGPDAATMGVSPGRSRTGADRGQGGSRAGQGGSLRPAEWRSTGWSHGSRGFPRAAVVFTALSPESSPRGAKQAKTVAGTRFSGAARSDTGGRSGHARDGPLDNVVGSGRAMGRRLAGRSGRGWMTSAREGRGAAGAAGCFT
jgi:hypothetical protein